MLFQYFVSGLLVLEFFFFPIEKRYLVNSYRVLLTRARQGMVLFVPKGVDAEEDPTRDSAYYDAIYEYLLSCGISVLDA